MSHSALLRLEALRKCNMAPNWVNADLYRLLYKTDLHRRVRENQIRCDSRIGSKCPSARSAIVRSTEENMMASGWRTWRTGLDRDTK
jgi:hypothetical protein